MARTITRIDRTIFFNLLGGQIMLFVGFAPRTDWRIFRGRGCFGWGWGPLQFGWMDHRRNRGALRRRWAYRLHRALLLITPWPVYVAFHGFCCDTGRYSWASRFRMGWQAWRATTYDALDGISDGPTSYELVTHADYLWYVEDVRGWRGAFAGRALERARWDRFEDVLMRAVWIIGAGLAVLMVVVEVMG